MAIFYPLNDGIYCVDALYVSEQVASIYLIREGDEVAVIETGTYHSVANLLGTLEALEIDPCQIRYVIPTHVHLDHAGGAGEMMRRFEQAELLIHPRGAAHMIDPEKLIAGTVAVYGQEKFDALYGRIEPVDESRVRIMQDSTRIGLQNRELEFFDTQGHARHHFCIYDDRSRGVFTGDSFGISYRPMKTLQRGLIPTTPPTQFDPAAMHATVEKIMGFDPELLYLTHYGEFAGPSAQVDSFNRWIDTYVDLTRRVNPLDEASTVELERSLTHTLLDGLSDAEVPLSRVLQTDLRLNAQGLAWWWQRTQGD